MNTLAEKLKNYRKEKNLTQPELAKELGIAKSVISDIESERRPASKRTLMKLAEHSEKSIDWWMNGVEGYKNTVKEELGTTKMVIEKLIQEGLLVNGNIDEDVAQILLNSLKIDIDLKLKREK